MKNLSSRTRLIDATIEAITGIRTDKANLYVAYINKTMISNNTADKNEKNADDFFVRNHRQSVFSTSGGSYYINGVPAILSQDDEAMLYEHELSEYY